MTRLQLHRIEVALRLPYRATLAMGALAQAGEDTHQLRIRLLSTRRGPQFSVRFNMIGGDDARAQRLLAWLLARTSPLYRAVPRLALEDIFARLGACPLALDHVGLTIPARHGAIARLNALRALLAPRGRVIAHPGTLDSLFIVPGAVCSADPPKFELALCSDRNSGPAVQLDIRTPYSLGHLRSLFAPSERQTVPIIEHHAVSLFAKVPWRRIALRIDLRARPVGSDPPFTDWLLQRGSRARAGSLSRARPA